MRSRRQEILDAALALADERGLDAVSMRAVAERTGVTPMALYPHVGSKAALLDGMVGSLLAELPVPHSAGKDWRDRLRALTRSARALTHRHPWASTLLFSRPAVTPDAVRVVEQIYAALLDADVPAPQVPRLERLVSTVILGFAASEAGGRFAAAAGPGPRGRFTVPHAGALPAHATLARWLCRPVDWDAEFDADVDDMLRLIEMAASRHGSRQAGRAGSPR